VHACVQASVRLFAAAHDIRGLVYVVSNSPWFDHGVFYTKAQDSQGGGLRCDGPNQFLHASAKHSCGRLIIQRIYRNIVQLDSDVFCMSNGSVRLRMARLK